MPNIRRLLRGLMMAAFMLCMTVQTDAQQVFWQPWNLFRGPVAINVSQTGTLRDTFQLYIGNAADTSKKGVRLGAITCDTTRAYKSKGSIIFERRMNAYCYYDGTKWSPLGVVPTLNQVIAAGDNTTDTIKTSGGLHTPFISSDDGSTRIQWIGHILGADENIYMHYKVNGTSYWIRTVSVSP